MKTIKLIICIVFVVCVSLCLLSCQTKTTTFPYLPKEGSVWFFGGQELTAVGGLEKYNEGYVDYIGVPAGITFYISLQNLDGLKEVANWGGGDNCGQYYLEDETFGNTMIAIGLYLVGQLQDIIDGKLDSNITTLGEWIVSANRPVFLRIGYEFDGIWNNYEPEAYKKAFRVIVDKLKAQGVNNFVTVWQSSGYQETEEKMMKWFPGEEYVDWLGYSYFDHIPSKCGVGVLAIARKFNKPTMIAEVTPRGYDLLVQDGPALWEQWFTPFINHVRNNNDVVKAVAYINTRWTDQPMWNNQGWGDTRIQVNDYIREKWVAELQSGFFIHQSINKEKKPFAPPKNIEELQLATKKSSKKEVEGVLQAENATLVGKARAYEDPQASNDSGVAYVGTPGDGIWFENVKEAKTIAIRYASPHSGKIGIYIDKKRKADFIFKRTGSWVSSYHTIVTEVDIPKGSKVGIQFDEGDHSTNVDYVKLQ